MYIKTAIAITALIGFGPAFADSYPSRPITFVVPTSAGGATDGAARMLAAELSKRMGQPIIVENKPGASGMLGVQAVIRSKPDGYTLLLSQSSALLNAPLLQTKPPYDARRDLAFVTKISMAGLVFVVNKDVPATNMKEFLAWAAQNKGKVSYGSYGAGGFGHLAGAYLSQSKGFDMTPILYKGEAPMIQDIIGGQITWGLAHPRTVAPLLANGRVRALAQFIEPRAKNLADVPTMVEAGLTESVYKQVGWTALLAPAKTPAPVLERLEKEMRAVLHQPGVEAFFENAGAQVIANSSADFRLEFESSVPLTTRMIRITGVKAE